MKITVLILTTLIFLFPDKQAVNSTISANWLLISITNLSTNQTQFADTSCGTTLHLDSSGNYSGFSGWNEYYGKYSSADNNKLIMDTPVHTKRGGPSNCKLGETLYNHYANAKNYSVNADTLILWTKDSIKITFYRK